MEIAFLVPSSTSPTQLPDTVSSVDTSKTKSILTELGLGIGALVVSVALCIVSYSYLAVFLVLKNKKNEAKRLAAMDSAIENIEFLDLTDKQNPLFVYVY